MARNKYPEKTIEKILSVSLKLFSEKGYDKTTIQDIIDALGMSKGAIYHHFKSKAEIMRAICDACYHNNGLTFDNLQNANPNMTGLEKLKTITRMQLNNDHKLEVDELSMDMLREPKFFMNSMKENLVDNAFLVQTLIEQGMEDGSIRKQDSKSASQILLMLINFWVYSPVTSHTIEDIVNRIAYFRLLCENMGFPIFDDAIEANAVAYFTHLVQHHQETYERP